MRPRVARLLTTSSALAALAVVLTGTPAVAHDPAPPRVYATVAGTRLHPKPPAWTLPVSGYHLTARFGQTSALWHSVHTGLDFAAPEGTPIRSVTGGVVVSTTYDGSYGNKTVIRIPGGTLLWYAHQSDFAVSPGEHVATGQLIGYVGATGNVTGPHLHLEVRPTPDHPVDPDAYLVAHGLHP
ncbi:MAG: M23 family metallopeptidase [Marmoricola sp.]